MLNEDSAFYLCTSKSQDDVRAEVEKNIQRISTDKAISVTYMKSSGDIKAGGSEKLQLVQVTQSPYENPGNVDSDNILLTSTTDFIKSKEKEVM